MYLSRGRINLLTIHCRRRRGRCLNHPLPPAGSVRRVLGALGAGLLATIRAAAKRKAVPSHYVHLSNPHTVYSYDSSRFAGPNGCCFTVLY